MPGPVPVLEALKSELRFLQGGGYRLSTRQSWRAKYVFEDSPTCPNSGNVEHLRECADCVLINFVPEQWRGHASPCRMIPLNDAGMTVEYLYGDGTPAQLQESVGQWLKKKIGELEAKQAKAA